MGCSLRAIGFWARGQLRSPHCALLTRSCSLWSWRHYLWGPLWVTKRIQFLCDNKAVVVSLTSGISKDPNLMFLLCYLSLLAVHHSFSFTPIRGKAKPVDDTLSCFQFQHFMQLDPHADQEATIVPKYLLASLPVV